MNVKIIMVLVGIIAIFIIVALLRNIFKSTTGTKRDNNAIRDNQQRQQESSERIDSGIKQLKQSNTIARERTGDIKQNTEDAGELIRRARELLKATEFSDNMG